MIVNNDEDVLSNCLESVRYAVDEIVIIDTSSSDGIKKIANKYTSKVLKYKWSNDFSDARNYSFSLATGEYIFWLDAQDVLLARDVENLQKLKQNIGDDVDIVLMKHNIEFDELGNVSTSYLSERLVKRSKHYKWKEPVHEYLDTKGNTIISDISITRTVDKNNSERFMKIYRLLSNDEFSTPRNQYYYAKDLFTMGKYDQAITYYKKFLKRDKGLVQDKISACLDLAKYYNFKNDSKNELKYLTETFLYDIPHAEACCHLGYFYKDKGDYFRAIFWFDTALGLRKDETRLGLIRHDCYAYIPAIELCICYYYLGDIDEAIKYNNWAGQYKPGDASVSYNSEYFARLTGISN
jgi:Glycosyltransferases involved in cell wall biogenesis